MINKHIIWDWELRHIKDDPTGTIRDTLINEELRKEGFDLNKPYKVKRLSTKAFGDEGWIFRQKFNKG